MSGRFQTREKNRHEQIKLAVTKVKQDTERLWVWTAVAAKNRSQQPSEIKTSRIVIYTLFWALYLVRIY